MAVTVRIRDFQAIKDATVEIDGLTVVSGPNNAGKTTVMRAIKGVFTNTPGHNFVRHGAEKCIVEITFDDGNHVKWEKGEKIKPKYTVNGKEIHPGKGVPDEVKAFGVVPIEAAGREIWPQVAEQFTGTVFLLDQPGAVLAEAIADVERVGHLNRALRESDRDKRAVTSKLKVRREDEREAETELESFEGLDDLVTQMALIEKQSKEVQRIENGLRGVKKIRDQLMAAQELVASLVPVEGIKVPSSKEMKELAKQQDALKEAEELQQRFVEAQAVVEATEGVEQVEVASRTEIQEVQETAAELASLRDLSQRYTNAKETEAVLAGVDNLRNTVEGLSVKQARKQAKALGIVQQLKGDQKLLVDMIRFNGRELENKQQELDEANAEVEEVLALLPVCPTCSRPVGEEHDHTSLED